MKEPEPACTQMLSGALPIRVARNMMRVMITAKIMVILTFGMSAISSATSAVMTNTAGEPAPHGPISREEGALWGQQRRTGGYPLNIVRILLHSLTALFSLLMRLHSQLHPLQFRPLSLRLRRLRLRYQLHHLPPVYLPRHQLSEKQYQSRM